MGRRRLLGTLAGLARGRFTGRPGTRAFRTAALEVGADAPFLLEVDGEVGSARRASVRRLPGKAARMRLNDDVAENRRLTRWAELLPRAPEQVGDVHETDAELVPLGDGRLLALTVDTVAEEIQLGLYRDPRDRRADRGRRRAVGSRGGRRRARSGSFSP